MALCSESSLYIVKHYHDILLSMANFYACQRFQCSLSLTVTVIAGVAVVLAVAVVVLILCVIICIGCMYVWLCIYDK